MSAIPDMGKSERKTKKAKQGLAEEVYKAKV
jgi:hypothetical protein